MSRDFCDMTENLQADGVQKPSGGLCAVFLKKPQGIQRKTVYPAAFISDLIEESLFIGSHVSLPDCLPFSDFVCLRN